MALPSFRIAAVYCLLLAVGLCLSQSLSPAQYDFPKWYGDAAICLADAANSYQCYDKGNDNPQAPNYDGCLCRNTSFLDEAIVCFDVNSNISSAFETMKTNCRTSGYQLRGVYGSEENWNSIASAHRTSSMFATTPTTPPTRSSTTETSSSASESTSSTTLATSKTPTTGSATIFPEPTDTPQHTVYHDLGGMSTGAKAGLGVGVGLGSLALLGALLWFFLKRRRSGNKAVHALSNSAVMSSDIISTVAPSSQDYHQGPAEQMYKSETSFVRGSQVPPPSPSTPYQR